MDTATSEILTGTSWHLPAVVGFHPFPETWMSEPGMAVRVVAPQGYRLTFTPGGVEVAAIGWADKLLDLTPLHFIAAAAFCYGMFRLLLH